MSGESAITKIKTRTQAWLTGRIGALVIHVDRRADDPFRDDELPCVNLRCPQFQIIERAYNADVWEAAMVFDVLAVSSMASTIDADQAEAVSAIIERMGARTPTAGTIGELIEICEPLTVAAMQDEMNLTDLGAATLAFRMVFRTPANDFRTIAGASGLVA